MTYQYADIGIRPAGSLAETALVLGQALGGLVFLQDTQGRFDEYPAFIAEAGSLRYALLGVPAPGHDIRDEPSTDFALLVQPVNAQPAANREDISGVLVLKIENDGRLKCWPLN